MSCRYISKFSTEDTPAIADIVTHEYNSAGNPLQIYDPTAGVHLDLGPLVVVDNNGEVVWR